MLTTWFPIEPDARKYSFHVSQLIYIYIHATFNFSSSAKFDRSVSGTGSAIALSAYEGCKRFQLEPKE